MKRVLGFSLLELMITLVIIGILIALTAPSYHYFIASKKVKTATQQLLNGIHYARSLAIHRSKIILFCGTSDDKTCDGHWDKGQLVSAGFKGEVFRHFPPLAKSLHCVWRSNFGKNKAIRFNSIGTTHGQQGHFALYRRKDGTLLVKIIILMTGRARVESNDIN